MAGVQGIEQRSRLDSANLAEDDPVGSPAKSGLEKVIERDARLECIRLTFDGEEIGLLDVKLRRVFDHDDALIRRNSVSEYAQKRRLSGGGSAAYQQCLSCGDLDSQKLGKLPRQRAASDEIIDRVMAARKLPNGQRRRRPHDRR